MDVGGIAAPDFEELVDSSNHVLEELDPSYSQHYCGVYTAIIPIEDEGVNWGGVF